MSLPKVKPKPWTALAYLVADDKGTAALIDAQVKRELKAIFDAADFAGVGIAAQVDFKRTLGVFRGTLTGAPTSRLRGFKKVLTENYPPLWREILGTLEKAALRVQVKRKDLNSAAKSVLQDFLRYGHEECPAERHLIFFHGHAYGPMGLFFDKEAKERRASTLRLNDLAHSMHANAPRATIVVFRDCYMNTLETAYQIRNVAEFMIASQAEAPIAGIWPWGSFMAALMPSAESGEVARALAMQLGRFLDEPSNRGVLADVPFSLIDLAAADAVVQPLKALVYALEDTRRVPKRRKACARALEAARVGYPDDPSQPGDPALVDVPVMCDNLQALQDDAVAGPARVLAEVVRSRLVKWHHSQKDRHQGTSIYYKPVHPRDIERSYIQGDEASAKDDERYYEQLALSEATGWHRIALNPLTDGTERNARASRR